jgi:hypothetical protein
MPRVSLVSKKPAGGAGNYVYVFSCTCDDGSMKNNITFTMANDHAAHAHAEMECQSSCGGETPKQA